MLLLSVTQGFMTDKINIFCLIIFAYFHSTPLIANAEDSLYTNNSTTTQLTPINDLCSGAIVMFDDGILDCDDFYYIFNNDFTGTPDPEASGSCVYEDDKGVWFTFTTPPVMAYNALYFGNTPGVRAELFSSTSGCGGLEFVECIIEGGVTVELEENTQYYILLGTWWMAADINNSWLPPQTECDNPFPLSLVHYHNVCETPSSLIPCENEYVHWRDYTTGCNVEDVTIVAETPEDWYPLVPADEISIVAVLDDCETLMSEYDPNGLGYVCSALGAGEILTLEDIPPNTSFSIGFGSGLGNMGGFKLSISSSDPAYAINDECSAAIYLETGTNTDFDNFCSSDDISIEGCNPIQNESSVWYIFNDGVGPQDIVIELNSIGIGQPAIAVYDDCYGDLLDQSCNGSPLELFCVELPLLIEVTSSTDNEGDFDLKVISEPSPPSLPVDVSSSDICSGTQANIDITIPNGDFINTTISVDPGSSPLISGMIDQTINGLSNITIDDLLVNNSTSAQEAIYSITFSKTGPGCPPDPIEVSILVHPKFNTATQTIDVCLPHLLEINIEELISGGSPPYSSISWLWNGADPIGSGADLSYDLEESGTLSVEVLDSEGCSASTSIDVTTTIPTTPTFDIPDEYCKSDQDFIIFSSSSLEGIVGTWEPSVINVSQLTTSEFITSTFTPNAFYCSEQITQTIFVYIGIETDFNLPSTLCAEEDLYVFPDTDLNGIEGNWENPWIDLSTTDGPQFNTFEASAPGCFANYEYEFEVLPAILLEFDIPESICKNSESITLDNFSQQGYEGTWDVSVIDPQSINDDFVTATWSPLSGQSNCLIDTTITIAITEPFEPSFNLPNEICLLDSIFTFPSEDLQSVVGIWSIDTIDPSIVSGTITSEFTPLDDCVESFSWEIEIVDPLQPDFEIDTSFCELDTAIALPQVSENGINGVWSIPIIDPSLYIDQQITSTFQAADSFFCVEKTNIDFEIVAAQDPIFDLPEKLCWKDSDFLLPNNSMNAIQGTWNPSLIEIQSNPGTTINSTFTPLDGNCVNTSTHSFEIISPYDVELSTVDPSDCDIDDGSILIENLQGDNLEYSIDGGINWQSSTLFDTLASGGYTILVRSTNLENCTHSIDAFLNANDGPILNDIIGTDLSSCTIINGSIVIDAVGNNLEYSIDGGISWQSSNEFNDLPAASYTILIREFMSDCTVEANVVLNDFPQTEILDVNTQDISDCSISDGQIEIIANGEALVYSIDDGINWTSDNVFQNLPVGNYTIIVQSANAEDCSESIMVELIAPSEPDIIDIEVVNPTLCSENIGSITIEGDGSNLEYSVDGGLTWQNNNLFEDLSAGDYQIIIRDSQKINCLDEESITIEPYFESLEESTFSITPPSDCDLEDGEIEITNPNNNVEFSIDGGTNWQTNTIFNNLPFGSYQLITRIISLPDCLVEQSIDVPEPDCPCYNLNLEFAISNITCQGDASGAIELTSVEGMSDEDINILWQDGSTGQIIEGVAQGWHVVTIEYDQLCVWTDSAYVDQLNPIQYDLIISDISCENISDGTIQVVNVDGGNNLYMYSLDGENFQSENMFADLEPGNYEVYVMDDTDCITIESVQILSPSDIEIDLPEITSIIQGESVLLDPKIDATQVDSFLWTNSNNLSNSTDLIIEVAPNSTTTYVLEIFYDDCYDRREITVQVNEEEDDIYVGNIFSPNGDNFNDILYIQGKLNSNIELNQFNVYDRWGNQVFGITQPQMNNADHGWDGRSRGKLVVSGVYVYQINFEKNGESLVKFGTVTIFD